MPKRVTATMTKSLRTGKVFVDWSQNNGNKTTIAPYSLRGREEPTVAVPRTWDEIEDPDLRHLRFEEVLERLDCDGDLLAEMDADAPVADALSTYRSMRDAGKTPEPVPNTAPLRPINAGWDWTLWWRMILAIPGTAVASFSNDPEQGRPVPALVAAAPTVSLGELNRGSS